MLKNWTYRIEVLGSEQGPFHASDEDALYTQLRTLMNVGVVLSRFNITLDEVKGATANANAAGA